jgi:chaperonin cofactor prefoldin
LYIKKLGSANQSPDLIEKNEYIAKIMEEKERMNTRMSELERVKREIGREYEDMRYKYMKLGNQNSK